MRINIYIYIYIYLLLNLFSCLQMTSEVQDITEVYIHLIHTKQYYTLQYIYIYNDDKYLI